MSENSSDNAVARFLGYALMVIGGMVLALSGLCTSLGLLSGIVGIVSSGGRGGGGDMYFLYVVVIGGPPIAVSLGMFFLGRWIVRSNTPSQAAPEPGRKLNLGEGQDPPAS